MKIMRNIISFLVGSTFALCLASCSGGMHDASTDPYKAGNVNASGEGSVFLVGGLAAAYVDASQYKSKSTTVLSGQTVFEVALSKDGNIDFAFSYQGSDTWGGGTGEINFAILSDVDNGWSPNMRWGGVSGSPVKAGGSADIEAGSTNITLSGMTSGHQYTLSGVLYAAGGVLSLEDKGEFTIPVPDYTLLDGYYVLFKSSDFKPTFEGLLADGVKNADEGTVTYTISFVPSADKDEFVIANNAKFSGTSYKGSVKGAKKSLSVRCDDPASSDGVALVKYVDKKSDDKDEKEGVNAPITHLLKDVETTITITTKTDGMVIVKVTSGDDTVNIANADIIFNGDNDFYDLTEGAFVFLYNKGISNWGDNDKFTFKVRPNKAWDGTQIGFSNCIPGNIPDGVNLSGKDDGNGGKNIVLSGLTDGTAYKLSFTPKGLSLILDIEEVGGLFKDEQDKLDGKWYFADIEISSTTVDMIVKDKDGFQSRDIKNVEVKDRLSYVCINSETLLSDKEYKIFLPLCLVSERTDTPTANGATGKTRIYVYTNAEKPNLYAWNGNDKFAGEWPGTAMTLVK